MSVEKRYNKGFLQGLESAAAKMASAYGIDKTALIDELKGMVGMPPEPTISDGEMAGGAASLAAGGLGFGADHLGQGVAGVEQQLDDIAYKQRPLQNRQQGLQQYIADLESGKAQPSQSKMRDMLGKRHEMIDGLSKSEVKQRLNTLQDAGGDAIAKAKASRVPGEQIQGNRAKDLLKRVQTQNWQPRIDAEAAEYLKNRKNDLSATTSQLDDLAAQKGKVQGSNMGRLSNLVGSGTLKGIGKGLKGLGAAGGLALLGNKALDVINQ